MIKRRKWTTMDLAVMGLLVALNIIASKYLALKIGDLIRLNFSSAFIMLSGIWLGPIGGALVGLVSDLLGCVMANYGINPLYTLMPVMIGVISGLCEPIFKKHRNPFAYGGVILIMTLVTSVIYGTWALTTWDIIIGKLPWMGAKEYVFLLIANGSSRLVQGLVTTVMNTMVVYLLYRSYVTIMLTSIRANNKK